MSASYCPLCTIRISDARMARGETEEVGGDVVHKDCIRDYELRTGLNFREIHENMRRKQAS